MTKLELLRYKLIGVILDNSTDHKIVIDHGIITIYESGHVKKMDFTIPQINYTEWSE